MLHNFEITRGINQLIYLMAGGEFVIIMIWTWFMLGFLLRSLTVCLIQL